MQKFQAQRRARRKGFTLIELIVVLGIIGVLLTLAIPTIEGLVQEATSTTVATNERLISDAYKQWSAAGGSMSGADASVTAARFGAFVTHAQKAAGVVTTTTDPGGDDCVANDNTADAAEVRLKKVSVAAADGTLSLTGQATLN